jgi:hypothetical protein
METQEEFERLLALFNAHKVEYVVVGGYALAFHGAPRLTGDLDLLVKPDRQNARRILAALDEFDFASMQLTLADFTMPEKVVQLGEPPMQVDMMTTLTGVSWENAAAGKVRGKYGRTPIHVISRDDFVANKKALGRQRDLADLEAIGEM